MIVELHLGGRDAAELAGLSGSRPDPAETRTQTETMANDQEKEAAARASLQFVKDGQVVGLGTGSTAAYFIKLLGEEVKSGLRVRGIPDFGAVAGTGAESGDSADYAR